MFVPDLAVSGRMPQKPLFQQSIPDLLPCHANAIPQSAAEPLRVLQLIAVLRWRDMVIGPECFAEIVVFAAFCPRPLNQAQTFH